MEVNETMQITLELKNPDGTSRVETTLFRYNYISEQSAQNASINVNCFDLADLVEKVGEVVLPEHVMKASPAQLREIGNQTYH